MVAIQDFALAGLRAASQRIQIRAENVVNVQTEGYRPAVPVQTAQAAGPIVRAERLPPERAQSVLPGTGFVLPEVSLEAEFADILVSETAYKASASLLRTSRELDQALFDILA